jgi:hypothetical protein
MASNQNEFARGSAQVGGSIAIVGSAPSTIQPCVTTTLNDAHDKLNQVYDRLKSLSDRMSGSGSSDPATKAVSASRFGLEIVANNIDGIADHIMNLTADLVDRIDP